MSVLLHPKLAVCTALFLSPLSAYLAISIYTHIIIILLQRRRRRRRKNSFRFFYDGHVRA
jgi:Flp pilus assembly protein TadB